MILLDIGGCSPADSVASVLFCLVVASNIADAMPSVALGGVSVVVVDGSDSDGENCKDVESSVDCTFP